MRLLTFVKESRSPRNINKIFSMRIRMNKRAEEHSDMCRWLKFNVTLHNIYNLPRDNV